VSRAADYLPAPTWSGGARGDGAAGATSEKKGMTMKKDGKELHWARALQKRLIDTADNGFDVAEHGADAAKEVLKRIDHGMGITDKAKEFGVKVREQSTVLDARYDLKTKISEARASVDKKAGDFARLSKRLAERSGVAEPADHITQRAREAILDPARTAIRKAGVGATVARKLGPLEHVYGRTREVIKPYFAAEDAQMLLANTRRELANVSACIMQISSSDSEKMARQFAGAVLAKVTGAAATGTLLALVAAFGTAGTGTAIATLSGAAAANATLAWVGGLLGGGMAAGAMLTGGIGLVVGLAAYKLLGSESRSFESLNATEQRLVQTCWLTIAIIDEHLGGTSEEFTQQEAEQLLMNVFRPLLEQLELHQGEICSNLDGKHAVAFRQHILTDFRRVVIDGFDDFIFDYPFKGFAGAGYAIGGVFYALLTQSAVSADVESQLVLDALRRSSNTLTNASEDELGEYLRDFSPDSLRGVAANVKGIYHELLYVHNYNDTHRDTYAEVFGATNHPGADIQIRDVETGEVLEQIQLKAVMDASTVHAHLEKYPDISVLATSEVANGLTDTRVGDSGHDNEILQSKVEGDLTAVADNTTGVRAGDAAMVAVGVASARELFEMLQGRRDFPDAVANALKSAGMAGTSTVMAACLFG